MSLQQDLRTIGDIVNNTEDYRPYSEWSHLVPSDVELVVDEFPYANCMIWATGCIFSGVVRSIGDRFDSFLHELLTVAIPFDEKTVKKGDIVLYGSAGNRYFACGKGLDIAHFALCYNSSSHGVNLESKWSMGPVFHHAPNQVPPQYGTPLLSVPSTKVNEILSGVPDSNYYLLKKELSDGTLIRSYQVPNSEPTKYLGVRIYTPKGVRGYDFPPYQQQGIWIAA